eukprot:g10156.t1
MAAVFMAAEGATYAPTDAGGEVFIPYVRNTFLSLPPCSDGLHPGARRCWSLEDLEGPQKRYARQVHSLMFKVQPLPKTPTTDISGAPPGTVFSSASEPGSVTGSESVMESEPIELEAEELAQVPLDEAGELTSIGSILHGSGECRPCAFLGSERRPCTKGVACVFCHFPHDARRKVRLGRRKRREMRISARAAVRAAGAEGISAAPRYIPISWPVGPSVGSGAPRAPQALLTFLQFQAVPHIAAMRGPGLVVEGNSAEESEALREETREILQKAQLLQKFQLAEEAPPAALASETGVDAEEGDNAWFIVVKEELQKLDFKDPLEDLEEEAMIRLLDVPEEHEVAHLQEIPEDEWTRRVG